jgi:hypothetical protein
LFTVSSTTSELPHSFNAEANLDNAGMLRTTSSSDSTGIVFQRNIEASKLDANAEIPPSLIVRMAESLSLDKDDRKNKKSGLLIFNFVIVGC